MKRFTGILVIACFLLSKVPLFAQQGQPNIIVYLSDDLGYLDTSPYGAKVVETPILEQLSKEGMKFNNAFVATPSCAPSRAALLTGLLPARNGAETNHSYPKEGIPYLIKNFKESGYKVYAFGKVAHYGGNDKCGFDYHLDQQVNLERNIRHFFDSVKVEGPVCLFVGDRRPHVAWTKQMDYSPDEVDLPPYFVDTKPTREHRSRYYTDITGLDSEMGKVLDYLTPIFGENTLTLFTSDHGAQWPFGKWNLYDAGIRTPLIVKWPGVIQAGAESDAKVSWIDILPTLLDISGSEIPKGLDGQSFKRVLEGKQTHFRDEIYTTHSGDGKFNIYPIRSVRTDQYKLIWNLVPDAYHTNHSDILRKDGAGAYWDSWDQKALKDLKAAAIIKKYYERPEWEFYDLKTDPDEQKNLMDDPEYQKEIVKLKKRLTKWLDKQNDELKTYREPYKIGQPKPNSKTIQNIK
ncbi:sulfatase [Echinicola marina]|uniref:sulfatase family protein n=1 Tax=Echinicola marina TaxID=2859768 RepID=UPI001CF6C5B2|nr:sulfatase [Echinicola marina]UCS91711.1 sulfatase [Echinicola marina]